MNLDTPTANESQPGTRSTSDRSTMDWIPEDDLRSATPKTDTNSLAQKLGKGKGGKSRFIDSLKSRMKDGMIPTTLDVISPEVNDADSKQPFRSGKGSPLLGSARS